MSTCVRDIRSKKNVKIKQDWHKGSKKNNIFTCKSYYSPEIVNDEYIRSIKNVSMWAFEFPKKWANLHLKPHVRHLRLWTLKNTLLWYNIIFAMHLQNLIQHILLIKSPLGSLGIRICHLIWTQSNLPSNTNSSALVDMVGYLPISTV